MTKEQSRESKFVKNENKPRQQKTARDSTWETRVRTNLPRTTGTKRETALLGLATCIGRVRTPYVKDERAECWWFSGSTLYHMTGIIRV